MTINPPATIIPPGKGFTYLVLGDLYTVMATGKETNGAYGMLEAMMQPGSAIPSHTHDSEEAHYVLEGEMEYQIDEQIIIATPGTFLHFPRGQSHSFKNIGSKPAKILVWVTPAGAEQFFVEAGEPVLEVGSEEEKRSLLRPPTPSEIEKTVAIACSKYITLTCY